MTVVVKLPPENQTFGVLSALVGAALVLGGDERASADIYSIITAHGGPYAWGAAFAAIGVAMILSGGGNLLMRELLLAGCAAYWVLAFAFMLAAIEHPNAGYIAMVMTGWAASLHFCAWKRTQSRLVV